MTEKIVLRDDGKVRNKDHGWVHDCLLIRREDCEEPLFIESNGTIRPCLDRYAIIPREEYEAVLSKLSNAATELVLARAVVESAKEYTTGAKREGAREALAKIKQLVDEQAKDDGLWFIFATAPEGYLQQELRKLHALIESLVDEMETGND